MITRLTFGRKKQSKDHHPVSQIPARTVVRVYSGMCPTCREHRDDLDMPCPWCGEVE